MYKRLEVIGGDLRGRGAMVGWGVALQEKAKSSKSIKSSTLLIKVVDLMACFPNVQTRS